jgi:putative hydrolase of the HAD superfamily
MVPTAEQSVAAVRTAIDGGSSVAVTVKAVLFDVGNTLLHVPEDPHQRSVQAAAHLGTFSFERYRVGIEQAKREWLDAGGAPDREDLSETWISHTKRALQMAEFDGDIDLAARRIEASFLLGGWQVYAEVHDVLSEIRSRSLRMGIVSNWPSTLEATLEAAGLRQYFEVVVASGVVGYAKPRPEIFRFALQQLEASPDQALFVGDNVVLDIEGPTAIGMPSVLIDRERRYRRHPQRIESLHELLDYLP